MQLFCDWIFFFAKVTNRNLKLKEEHIISVSWQNNNLFKFRQKEIHICALCSFMNSIFYIHLFIDVYSKLNDHHQLNMNKYQRTATPPSPLPPAPVGTYRIIERCKKTPLSCFFQKHSFEDTQCQNSSQYVSSSQDQHRLL